MNKLFSELSAWFAIGLWFTGIALSVLDKLPTESTTGLAVFFPPYAWYLVVEFFIARLL